MELPRLHPADRAAAGLQAASVLMVGGWSTWTTYGAAQSWGWLPDWAAPMVAVTGGAGAAVAAVAGLLGAGVAGAQSARREMNAHREAQAADRARVRAEVVETGPAELTAEPAERGPGRHRAPIGRRRGGWAHDQAAIAPAARRVLDDAAERLALPVGARGTATAAARMVEHSPAGVDLAERPGDDAGMATGPEDPRWAPALLRLRYALTAQWRPGDGDAGGRGVSELAELVELVAPELPEDTVLAFIGDYVALRAGLEPSGLDWGGVLPVSAQRGETTG